MATILEQILSDERKTKMLVAVLEEFKMYVETVDQWPYFNIVKEEGS